MSSQLVKLIKEICAEDGISFGAFEDEYILVLQKNGRKMLVYGNKFACNNAASEQLCDDKAGLSALLKANGIPCVEHRFFASPAAHWYASETEKDRLELLSMLEQNPAGLVVKENKGSGGINVYRAANEAELFSAAQKVFAVSPALAVSPYINIKHEYRVLMLGTEYRYAFEKLRPFVRGNGRNTVNELLLEKYGEKYRCSDARGEHIPPDGEKYMPEWRHNLGQGAIPSLVTESGRINALQTLAKRCMESLSLGFASVDIIDDGETLRVLEINSGVMIDNFSAFSDEYYQLAKSSIKAAIRSVIG